MTKKGATAKHLYEAGLISKETLIEELWREGLLVWDEAIDAIIRVNVDKRRHSR